MKNPLLIAILITGIMYIIVGIYAWKLSKPMHFWAGLRVKEKDIVDIKAYNRANGLMWITYALVYILCAILVLLGHMLWGLVVLIVGSSLGLIGLMYTYVRIYEKYRVKSQNEK